MYALEINNLSKTYANGLQALRGINLTVQAGDFFALLGPNGAGKSTCIGIITSLVSKTSGHVKVFGHSIDNALITAKSLLGSVPQEFNFNTFETVSQIVINQGGFYGVPRKHAQQKAHHYLQALGLWPHRNIQARSLSGGMKRRLMIARALIHQPKLLILDEPTAGVDIELRRSMWTFMDEINHQGTTIILTTHYLEEAERMCRNIAIIDEGRLIQNTSMRSLLQTLNSETLIFYLDTNLDSPPQLNNCPTPTLIDHQTLEVEVPKSCSLNDLIRQFDALGIIVNRMKNKVNRLEALFMRITVKEKEALHVG